MVRVQPGELQKPELSRLRLVTAVVAAFALVYMFGQAHDEWRVVSQANGLGADFHGTIWKPDRAILHGRSPYPPAGHIETFARVPPAVYLPPIFIATLPLGLVPLHAATWIWFALLLCATLAIPAVLGVRDPWCYALWLPALPVVDALALGNATILVALGAALAWRFRDRPLAGPLAAAAAVAIKPWLWPLLVWLLVTRPRAGARAVVAFAAGTLAAWAAIRFDGLLAYPGIAHAEADRFARLGVFLIGALTLSHVGVAAASAVGLAVGVAILALAYLRRAHDLQAYSLALLAALVATPVAWSHYLILAALPLAIRWPTLSPAWLWFPAVYYAKQLVWSTVPQHGVTVQDVTYCLLVVAAAGVVRSRRRRPA